MPPTDIFYSFLGGVLVYFQSQNNKIGAQKSKYFTFLCLFFEFHQLFTELQDAPQSTGKKNGVRIGGHLRVPCHWLAKW